MVYVDDEGKRSLPDDALGDERINDLGTTDEEAREWVDSLEDEPVFITGDSAWMQRNNLNLLYEKGNYGHI